MAQASVTAASPNRQPPVPLRTARGLRLGRPFGISVIADVSPVNVVLAGELKGLVRRQDLVKWFGLRMSRLLDE